eukprot:CAMPEP_0119326220 /NCGR_PEP_ID=MMETSP1333-20130426/67858_1 /TAXON_ID=418940 /ORGANISM="Scyphosphaera apsteinii, Strain RCC1455" /LENGTH=334 /DNA_ID=CAMNT_0007334467 /DNA_START=84 /DNA_END=1085 /DNA_ORIENTATION=-
MSTALKLIALLASVADGTQYIELRNGEAGCNAAGYDYIINLNECHFATKQLYKDKIFFYGDLSYNGEPYTVVNSEGKLLWSGSGVIDLTFGMPSGCDAEVSCSHNPCTETSPFYVKAMRNRKFSAATCGNVMSGSTPANDRTYTCICKVANSMTETSFPLFSDEDIRNSATPAAYWLTAKPDGKVTDFLRSSEYTCSDSDIYKVVPEGTNCYEWGLEDICDLNECKFAIAQASDPSEGSGQCASDIQASAKDRYHDLRGCARVCSDGWGSAICQGHGSPNEGPNGGYGYDATGAWSGDSGLPGPKTWHAYVNTYGSVSEFHGLYNPTGDGYFKR